MSESSDERDPLALGELDPAEFVGEPPAGDQDPTGFTSGDQSPQGTGTTGPSDATDAPDPAGSADSSSTTEEDA